jgi:hypothetical protein
MTRRQYPSSVGVGIRLFAPHPYSVTEHTPPYRLGVGYFPGSNAAEVTSPSVRNVWGFASISPHVIIAWCLTVVYKNEVNLFTLLLITMRLKFNFALLSS